MAVPPVAMSDLFRMQVVGRETVSGQHWVNNVQMLLVDGSFPSVTFSDLFDSLFYYYNVIFKQCRTPEVECFRVQGNRFNAAGTLLDVGTRDYTPVPGEYAGEPLPLQNCAVISIKADGPSKHTRGRIYLPGVPIGTQVAGAFNVIATTLFNTAANLFFKTFHEDQAEGVPLPGGVTWTAARISREVSGQAVNYGPITLCNLNPLVRAQRRRQGDRGI